MIDFTEEILEYLNIDDEYQEFDIPTKYGNLIVNILLNDSRIFSPPSYDSPDGLSELVSGDISFDLNTILINEDDDIIDLNYNIDENKIYDFLNS